MTRQKVTGVHLKKYMLFQLPVLPPSVYRPVDVVHIATRVLELVYTADDMCPLANALRDSVSPHLAGVPSVPYRWDETRRAVLRAELDAWFAVRAMG